MRSKWKRRIIRHLPARRHTPLLPRVGALAAAAAAAWALRDVLGGYGALFPLAAACYCAAGIVLLRRQRLYVEGGVLHGDGGVLIRRYMDLPLSRLREVRVCAGPLARLLHYGTVRVYTRRTEAEYRFVREPEAFCARLEELRARRQ